MDRQSYGILVIQRNQNNQVSGSIYHHLHEEKLSFNGFMELTEKLQLLSELLVYPMTDREEDETGNAISFSQLQKRVNQIEGGAGSKHTYCLQLYHRFHNTYQGILEEQESGKSWKFNSFLELVRTLEEQVGIPPEQTSFPEAPAGTYMYRRDDQKFAITVLFCRNNNWQGTVRWVNGKRTINFKTCLELLLILQDICSDSSYDKAMCTGD